MNVLLLPLPFALASHAAGWPAGATFVLALLPLCSLAEVRAACRKGDSRPKHIASVAAYCHSRPVLCRCHLGYTAF
jgi:hypothetical protein